MDQTPTHTEVTDTPEQPLVAAAKAPKAKRQANKGHGNKTKPVAKQAKAPLALDDVMALLDQQDEVLKAFATQTKEMLVANANLRRVTRTVVKEASRHDHLTAELNRYKKKWANLKSIVD